MTCASDTSVLVTEVPMFAPMMIGMAPSMVSAFDGHQADRDRRRGGGALHQGRGENADEQADERILRRA